LIFGRLGESSACCGVNLASLGWGLVLFLGANRSGCGSAQVVAVVAQVVAVVDEVVAQAVALKATTESGFPGPDIKRP
jgi:hypothetical protein